MPPTELDLEPLEDLASVFKGLSDPTRLAILGLLLLEDEMCVCDIENVLGITQSRSSRHLRYLANARLVSTKRVGPWVHYRITTRKDPARLEVIDTLRKTLHGPGIKGLEKRLAQWKRTKGSACASAPTKAEVSHV